MYYIGTPLLLWRWFILRDLITCSRCGKIVERGHVCPNKKTYSNKKGTEAEKFRNSANWKKKSVEIKQRDKYLCRVCLDNKYNTLIKLNFTDLEVHHITPLNEDYSKRLDNDNLITLCKIHHVMAERNEIPKEYLLGLASSPPVFYGKG